MTLRPDPATFRGAALRLTVAAYVLLAVGAASGEVFKCAGRGGIPVYQDTPCPAGTELRNFQTDPPAITVLPAPEVGVDARPAPEPRRSPTAAAAVRPAPPASEARAQGDAALRKFIRAGMTEGEVVAKLGPPEVTSRGAKSGGNRWTYLPAARDPDTITIITFAKGVVADVERRVSK